ncbi:hypothetical protein [Streptomyces sp. NPDC057438]
MKTVTSGSGGALTATVRAGADGHWRWSFAGNASTSTAKTAGVHGDVR